MDRIWGWLFAGTLLLPTAVALLDPPTPGHRPAIVLIASAMLGWHLLLFPRVLLGDDEQPGWAHLAYWVGIGAGAVVLAGWQDAYTVLLYGLFPLLLATLQWWGIPGVAAMTALVTWRIGFFDDGWTGMVNVVVSTALSALIGIVIQAISRQSALRREALAQLAATRAELAEVAHRAGVAQERERLAREIHDTVAQDLVSVVTHLQAAELAMPDAPPDAHRHVGAAAQAARDGLAEVRRAVQAMRPDLLADGGLAEALDRLCTRWSARTGILARFAVVGEVRGLHPDREVALLRAAQEALANVARHARATAVTVELVAGEGVVDLRVVDDGVGLPHQPGGPAEDGSGFGLRAMAERLAEVGGRVDLGPAPAGGTRLSAQVPT